MTTTAQLQDDLDRHPKAGLRIELPDGQHLPAHFHITEVGRVTKSFIDCGGISRQSESCVLQTLVADDVDHRLRSGKLAGILRHRSELGISDDVPVELEVQLETIGTYSLQGVLINDDEITLRLSAKRTECLAPELCGVPDPVVIPIELGRKS
ncbi:MAG: DUF6428 family protein [Planctomycetota bacterium]